MSLPKDQLPYVENATFCHRFHQVYLIVTLGDLYEGNCDFEGNKQLRATGLTPSLSDWLLAHHFAIKKF
jgi:hypothetical protein